MKKDSKEFKKHMKRFLALAKAIFVIIFAIHAVSIVNGDPVIVLNIQLNQITSLLIAFVALSMAVMSSAYYCMFAKKKCSSGTCGSSGCEEE